MSFLSANATDLRGARVGMLGSRYAVFAKDGRQLSGPTGSVEEAEAMLDRRRRALRQIARPCITCTKPFDSEGPHNRMCPDCRNNAQEAVAV